MPLHLVDIPRNLGIQMSILANVGCVINIGKIQVLFDSIRAANDNEKLLAKVNAQEDDIVAGKISVKYHHNCRSSYLMKRPHAYLSEQNVRPKRSSFNFKELCFVCAKSCDRRCKRDRKRGWALITDKHNIFAHVHAEAIRKGDTDMILRLNGIECKDMVAADCRYHRGNKLCLSKYLGLNDKIETNKPAQSRTFAPEEVQCSTSAAALLELDVSADEGSEMCISSEEYTDWPSNIQEQNYTSQIQSKDQAIYGVVSLLRADIAAMTQKITHYPEPSDLEIEECQKYVPLFLLQAALWMVDQNAFENVLPFSEASSETKLKAVTLSETIMCMSGNTVTPQPLGTAVYLDHVFGSSELIDVVSGLGYCVSYDELRRYKTSAAQHTLTSSQTVAVDNIPTYVPTDLKKPDNREVGNGLMHEGTDNVDINVETKDGKGTFHALARFMFQDQCVSRISEKIAIPRMKDKSLKLSDEVLKLVEREPYQLPPTRPVPPRTHDAVKKMNDLKLCNQATNGTKDTTWLLLRMVPRGVLPDIEPSEPPEKIVVPLWKGYHHQISVPQPRHLKTKTHRAHLPIIDAPPSDKRTLYTSMVQCKRLTKSLGQESSVQTMDLQLYALAQEVKWHLSDEFASHILRMGSSHAMMSFLSSMGKIWGDAGLRDLLVDSGVYAAGTVELFLQGKEYNRAVTAFIYAYEALSQVRFSEFLKWLRQNKRRLPDELWEQLHTTKELLLVGSKAQSAITHLHNLVEEHVQS